MRHLRYGCDIHICGCLMLALLGARSVLGLCLCPFGRLYKCYPPVSSYTAWVFLLLNLFSSFSLLTHFVTRAHYNTMGLILPTLMSSAIYRKCYHHDSCMTSIVIPSQVNMFPECLCHIFMSS